VVAEFATMGGGVFYQQRRPLLLAAVKFAPCNGDCCYYRRRSLLSVAAIATGGGSHCYSRRRSLILAAVVLLQAWLAMLSKAGGDATEGLGCYYESRL
jgi:hypothetical protein